MGQLPFLIGLIAVALAFDFLNGMNDAANSIATIVSTRVLRPQWAVVWASFFNFVAFLFFGLHVAETVGRGIVEADVVNSRVIFGALSGAICWQIVTQRLGIPSSSSHALIGGLVGAGISKAGTSAVVWAGVAKTAVAIVMSPGIGCLLALFLMLLVSWLFVRFTPHGVDHVFRRAQFVSASLYALGHGGNDAQKTMGIIAVLLYSQGYLDGNFHVPFWVVIACQLAMAAGTLAGGWRIVRTMGSKITRLTPVQGACAETGGSIMLFAATELGIPVEHHLVRVRRLARDERGHELDGVVGLEPGGLDGEEAVRGGVRLVEAVRRELLHEVEDAVRDLLVDAAGARAVEEADALLRHLLRLLLPHRAAEQVRGLGQSSMAQRYAISGIEEARAYLAHPVLGARLVECARALGELEGSDPVEVLGHTDGMKLRSSMTLFARAAPDPETERVFRAVLDQYYGGQEDAATVERL